MWLTGPKTVGLIDEGHQVLTKEQLDERLERLLALVDILLGYGRRCQRSGSLGTVRVTKPWKPQMHDPLIFAQAIR